MTLQSGAMTSLPGKVVRTLRRMLAEAERRIELRRWDPSRPRPLSSSAEPEWLRPLAIKGSRAPFENLPPPAQLATATHATRLDDVLGELKLADLLARDSIPVPATSDREGYNGDHHYEWWLYGLRDYLTALQILKQHGLTLKPGDSMLELGCATGRVLRHFVCQQDGLRVHGADINLRYVEWLRNYLPPQVRVFQNTALPHLPLADHSMSLVCAYSVFTHIDELELAWIAEVARILRPGGVALLTIHSEHTWRAMRPGWPIHDALLAKAAQIPEYAVSPALFAGPLPAPRTAFWWRDAQVYNSDLFHAHEYIRSAWGRWLRVEEIRIAAHDYQDVVVLRKE